MKYRVVVEAVIRKTYEVEAEDSLHAHAVASEMFTVEPEGNEYYKQDSIDIEEMGE